jgi:hypothetical protein
LLSLGSDSVAQGTLQFNITFDGPPLQPTNTSYSLNQYSELGFLFTPISPSRTFGRLRGQNPGWAENGTAFLQAAFTESLQFSRTDAALFDLGSVDLAEYSIAFPNRLSVQFIAHLFNGTTVTTNFITDGIIDGTGPLADFQTFHFGPEFTGLTRVEIPTYGWSLDNLFVSIPEPASGLLLLTAAGLLISRSRSAKEEGTAASLLRPATEAGQIGGDG